MNECSPRRREKLISQYEHLMITNTYKADLKTAECFLKLKSEKKYETGVPNNYYLKYKFRCLFL
jgi:hypothetical protein